MRSISNVARRRDDGLGATNSGPYSFAVRVIVDGALDDGQLLGALRFPRSPALADTAAQRLATHTVTVRRQGRETVAPVRHGWATVQAWVRQRSTQTIGVGWGM